MDVKPFLFDSSCLIVSALGGSLSQYFVFNGLVANTAFQTKVAKIAAGAITVAVPVLRDFPSSDPELGKKIKNEHLIKLIPTAAMIGAVLGVFFGVVGGLLSAGIQRYLGEQKLSGQIIEGIIQVVGLNILVQKICNQCTKLPDKSS